MISSRFTSPSHFYEPAVDYVASRCFENVSQSSALSDRPSSHGHVNHDFTNVTGYMRRISPARRGTIAWG
ncbi:hypothetical protein CC2G_014361 [Coprinopsis cinerea AmutBmut pab1-1]|nr:hypothetical protein CC2G_014361 [Coprinopsis cinerea AmutBmut pab1-1]